MQAFTVSFFGHRIIKDSVRMEQKLEVMICKLLNEKDYVEFLVGRDGEFDLMAASAIRRCKREYRDDNSSLVWVLPYETAQFRNNEEAFREYYDEIEVCEISGEKHFKEAHRTRNRVMVDRSDLVVFCVQHESGGAWQTMQYALQKGVRYINLHCCSEGELR